MNGLNFTSTVGGKVFRLRCDADLRRGDGVLNADKAADTMAACLDACARQSECVGAVFDATATPKECWLQAYVGVIRTGTDKVGVASGILWQ